MYSNKAQIKTVSDYQHNLLFPFLELHSFFETIVKDRVAFETGVTSLQKWTRDDNDVLDQPRCTSKIVSQRERIRGNLTIEVCNVNRDIVYDTRV